MHVQNPASIKTKTRETYYFTESSRRFIYLVNCKSRNKQHGRQGHHPADQLGPCGVRLFVVRHTIPLNYICQDNTLKRANREIKIIFKAIYYNTLYKIMPKKGSLEPSGPYFYSLLNGMLVHRRVLPSIMSPVPIYIPGWRETL